MVYVSACVLVHVCMWVSSHVCLHVQEVETKRCLLADKWTKRDHFKTEQTFIKRLYSVIHPLTDTCH